MKRQKTGLKLPILGFKFLCFLLTDIFVYKKMIPTFKGGGLS
jgi:hypothetical protein